jgi:hypothetical protein
MVEKDSLEVLFYSDLDHGITWFLIPRRGETLSWTSSIDLLPFIYCHINICTACICVLKV